MLRAYASTTADEFIAQLRTYVIAMGLDSRVVACVDNLTGIDDNENELAEAEAKGEKDGIATGRKDMKAEIIAAVTEWLESHQSFELIAPACNAMIAEIEKVEI